MSKLSFITATVCLSILPLTKIAAAPYVDYSTPGGTYTQNFSSLSNAFTPQPLMLVSLVLAQVPPSMPQEWTDGTEMLFQKQSSQTFIQVTVLQIQRQRFMSLAATRPPRTGL